MTTISNFNKIYKYYSNTKLIKIQRDLSLDNKDQAFSMLCWSKEIASTIHPILHTLEICLRNAISNRIKDRYKTNLNDWVSEIECYGKKNDTNKKQLKEDWQKAKSKAEKAFKDSGKDITLITFDDIVAQCDLFLWQFLCTTHFFTERKNKEQTTLWPKEFYNVFNGLSTIHILEIKDKLSNIVNEINEIRKFRNRIAHYDSLWSINRDAGKPIEQVINYLNGKVELMVKIISYLNNDLVILLENKKFLEKFKSCNSLGRVEYYLGVNTEDYSI